MHLASRMNVVQAGRHPVPHHLRGSLSLPGSVPWAEWGKQELTAREGGKWHYISLQKKEAGLPCEQKADTRTATEAVQPLLSSSGGLGSGV